MSLAAQLIRGVAWVGASQMSRTGINFLVTITLARLLSPDAFGLAALATMLVGVVNVLSSLGFSAALVQRKEITDEHLDTAWWLSLAVSTGLALVIIALAGPIAILVRDPRVGPLLRVLPLSMPIGALGQIPFVLLQRRLAFRQIALVDFSATLVGAAAGIGLALLHFGAWTLVGQAIGVTAATTIARYATAPWRPRAQFIAARGRELAAFGLPVIGGGLVNFAAANVDNALVGRSLGAATLGVYALAYNLTVLPSTLVGGLVSSVMLPALSKLQAEPERFRRGYLRMLRVVSSGALPLVLGLWATAPLLVSTVYGTKWLEAASVVRHLVLIGMLQGINVSGNVFYSLGRPGLIFSWAVFSVTCMSIALAIGVRYGVYGVTFAYTLVSPVVLFAPHLIANRLMRLRFIDFVSSLAPAVVCSLLMAATVYSASAVVPLGSRPLLVLFTLIAVGALTYASSLAAMALTLGVRPRGFVGWLTGQHFTAAAVDDFEPRST